MQLHRNVEDVRATLVVNVLTAESGAKIAEDAHSSAGNLGEVDLCACSLS